MNNKLSIQDLALVFAEQSGMDVKASTAFVKTVFEIIEEYIAIDKIVKIKGFGTFKLINVSDRESVNVNTGERIVIAGHTKLSFTPDTVLKDAVNRPFADFETTPLNESTSIEEMERVPEQDEELVEETKDDEPVQEMLAMESEESESSEEVLENPQPQISEEEPADELPEVIEEETIVVLGEETTPEPSAENAEAEDKAITPVATNKRPKAEIPSSHKAEENPSYPMASESVREEEIAAKGTSHKWAYITLTIILMVLSYLLGHYQVLSNLKVALYPEEQSVEEYNHVQPEAESKPNVSDLEYADSVSTDTIMVDSVEVLSEPANDAEQSKLEEDPEEIAKYFPQVPGGEYWIVGDAGYVHHMQVGETLYRIARKELGDRNLIRYLIVFNDFEDPNLIHTGDPIRIPKLVKKQQATTE